MNVEFIKQLRNLSGCSLNDCKNAYLKHGEDFDKCWEYLVIKNIAVNRVKREANDEKE